MSSFVQLLNLTYVTLIVTLSLAARLVVDARSLSRSPSSTTRHREAPLTLPRRYDYIFYNKSVDGGLDRKDDDDDDDEADSDNFSRRNSPKREMRLSRRRETVKRSNHGSISYGDEQPAAEPGTQRVFHDGPLEDLECPLSAEDRRRLFPCVTPDQFGYYICIDDHALCDSVRHCPNGEDEDGTVCMFHRMTLNYFKIIMTAVVGLTKSVV